MGGGKGLDRKGNNGGRPLDSNPRSEPGKTANAPKKDIVILTNAERVAQRIVTVDSQAGQRPYEFVYDSYGGFSKVKYAATYDHDARQRQRDSANTSSGTSGGGAFVVSSPARSKVSATPPQQQQQQEQPAPDIKCPTKSSTGKSSKSSKSSGKSGPVEISCPEELTYEEPPKSNKMPFQPIKTEAFAQAGSTLIQSIADGGQSQSGVKTEQPSPKRTSRRHHASPTPPGTSTPFSVGEPSSGITAKPQQPPQIHRSAPQHLSAVGPIPAFETSLTTPSYFSPGHQAGYSIVAAQGGSGHQLYASHQVSTTHQPPFDGAMIYTTDQPYDFAGTSASSSVGFSAGGGGDPTSVLAEMARKQQEMERQAAEFKQQFIQMQQYLLAQHQPGAQSQQHQAAVPEQAMMDPSDIRLEPEVDEFVAKLIHTSPHAIDDIRNADSNSPTMLTYLKDIEQEGSGVSDPSMDVVVSAIKSEIKAEVDSMVTSAKQSEAKGKRSTTAKRKAPKRKTGGVDNQPLIPSKQIKKEATSDEEEQILALEALTILRARYGGRCGAQEALAFMEHTHEASELVKLSTIETALKIELSHHDPDFLLKGDLVTSPAASVHDAVDDENSRDPDYQPSSSKHRKHSADTASVAETSVADEEVAGRRKLVKKPMYQPWDLDGNRHLRFEKNKFADAEYSDTESKLKPCPADWKTGEYLSGGMFPALHLTHNIKDCNYGIHQQHDLIGHTPEESTAIEARIRTSVEGQLHALQGRLFHVSDPRHLSKREQRDFAGIIRNPSTWQIDGKLPTGIYQPPLNSRTVHSAEGAKAKQFGGYKFSFEPTEARHVKGYAKAEELQPVTICPADYRKALAGMPSFYRLKYSSAERPEIYKTKDCTAEIIADYFNHPPKNQRDMSLAINGDIIVEAKNGESAAVTKAKAIKALGYMLKKNAEKLPKINLSNNLLYLVWCQDAPLPRVHEELWPWLEQMKKQGQVFARYTDLKVDLTSEDQVATLFDTTGRNSLLSFALGRGCEHSLPHSTITMNAGVIHKVGQNQALLPSHHHATSGAFVEYLLEKPDEVIKVMKKDFYPKEFEKCSRWDTHRKYLFNPDLLEPYGLKYVMGIRRAGETTNVLEGGLMMSLSFGVAESNSVDWLSAPPSWLVTHKPQVSAIYCREKASRSYIDQRVERFEGAFETLTGIQDPGARVMRDPINSCFNCIKGPDPFVDGYVWLKNHLSAFKTGDTPRANCCPNPIGHVAISKRVELRESVAKQRLLQLGKVAEKEDQENAAENEEDYEDKEETSGDEHEPSDIAVIKTEPSDQQETEAKEPVGGAPGVEKKTKTVEKKTKTSVKGGPKAKGQEKTPEPAKAESSADVVTNEPGSSGAASIPTPPLTKKQQQAKKVKQEKTKKPHAAASIGDDETSGDDKLAIAIDAEDGGGDPSKVKRDGDLQSEDAKVVTEPIVSDLQMDEKGEQSPAADGGEESSEAEFITDDDSDQEVPAAEKTGKGSEADSDVGDPPIAQPAVSVGDGSGGGDPDEEMEEIEADEEDEEADDEEDEEMDDQE